MVIDERNVGSGHDDMSMEEILASIKKYVSSSESEQSSDRGSTCVDVVDNRDVIELTDKHLVDGGEKMEMSRESSSLSSSSSIIGFEGSSDGSSVSSERVVDINQHVHEGPFSKPFEKLSGAFQSYERKRREQDLYASTTIDQFFTNVAKDIIKKWIEDNMMRIVEEMVEREIEKMKSEV